jgi:hypothetical protein
VHVAPSSNSVKKFLAPVLGVIAVLGLALSVYLFLENQNLKTVLMVVADDTKSAVLPFSSSKDYVQSTTVFQQVIGTVVAYDEETYTITLDKNGELFTVELPLGPGKRTPPRGFADLSGMSSFKVGDEVTVGGQTGPLGEFEITRFVISNQ